MSDTWSEGLAIDLNKDGNATPVKGSAFEPHETGFLTEELIRVATEEKCLIDCKIQGTTCPNTKKYKVKGGRNKGKTIDLALGFDPKIVQEALDNAPDEPKVFMNWTAGFPLPQLWIPTEKRTKRERVARKKTGYQYTRK